VPASSLTGVVLFASATGVTAMDAATGSTLFARAGVPALGDWSTLFATSAEGPRTSRETYDSGSGERLSTGRVPDGFGVRIAANDGSQVALVRGAPAPDDWTPYPRATTDILVTDPSGVSPPERYLLEGNFDPEAFSSDGRRLFLLEYVPATAPTSYRVTTLDLERGQVSPVFLSHEKRIAETMSGTRLEQLAPPDGRYLFTLYTSEPSAYLGDGSTVREPVAFVHVLDLGNGTAHCIALPEELWGGDPGVQAMAVSPSGDLLYVADTERGIVAEIATQRGKVRRVASVDFPRSDETHAVVTDRSRLVVASGPELVTVDAGALRPSARHDVGADVRGLGTGDRGLLVSTKEGVEVLDPTTGETVDRLPARASSETAYVGSVDL
ncbi:MAG TPA: hypothetical protein VG709_07105, partial [Actinomycetota bacterium]|nr:hypothetical protein [Actinomycetota bacterium]